MDLVDLVGRPPLMPGEARLPWADPSFSARMLVEHLDDTHDMASRRGATIQHHVEWLAKLVPDGQRVLDLGCGPGLYLEGFARAGWQGVGVDMSPAAIDYAARRAVEGQLACSYVQGDFRDAEVHGDFDLVLCLFGELSTLPLDDVRTVLSGASSRLHHGGCVVIEVSTYRGVTGKGRRPVSWYTANGGLFAEGRHLVLRESQWFEAANASVERWWVIDETAPRPRSLGTTTWWHPTLDDEIVRAGLAVDARYGNLSGAERDGDDEFETLVLRAE